MPDLIILPWNTELASRAVIETVTRLLKLDRGDLDAGCRRLNQKRWRIVGLTSGAPSLFSTLHGEGGVIELKRMYNRDANFTNSV
jgi:hypothetical protein